MPSPGRIRIQPTRPLSGFTLLELMVTLAILSILGAMTFVALSSIKRTVSRRSMVTDLFSQMAVARTRAAVTERIQIVVIDAVKGTNGTYGYYYFEDAATPPTIFSGAQLGALLTAMNSPPTVPAGYSLTLRDSRESSTNGYYTNADAWDGPLPFPWTALGPTKLDLSTKGCSFCSAGYGAVGFLPTGRVVFSDGNVLGGFIVVQGDSGGTAASIRSGVGISPIGFVQQVER